MPSTIYALVDCNNFFVSCERVFNPKLCKRPVVVLSNNDGCAISRSSEAKALGIPMGAPLFTIKDLVRRHNVAILSSNFALYADLSARVMSVIADYVPELEIYSIDEAFLKLSSLQQSYDVHAFCANLAAKLEQYTGIPVSIGIAPTRTLAKVANHVAKTQNQRDRVCYLASPQQIQSVLADFKLGEVWGVGRQTEKKLQVMGMRTAGDLAAMTERTSKANFNIVMWRTVQELNGTPTINFSDNIVNKQQIMVSRSFGQRVTELADLQQAVATYASMACEKLRAQNSVAGGFYIFLHTGLHGATETIYKNSGYITLASPSNDTRVILNAAKQALTELFKSGYRYKKVGIILSDLGSAANMQIDLFGHTDLAHSEQLMMLMDDLNRKFGRSTVQFAAAGLTKSWRMRNNHKSSNYTSSWSELPIVSLK